MGKRKIDNLVESDSAKPNNNPASKDPTGVHLPKIMAARAMNPRRLSWFLQKRPTDPNGK